MLTIASIVYMITLLLFLPQEQTVALDPSNDPVLVNEQLAVYHTIDTLDGQEAWEKIINNELQVYGNPVKGDLRVLDDGFWIVLRSKNENPANHHYYFELAFNRTDQIRLYEISDNQASMLYQTGDLFPFNQRPLDYRNFIFPVEFDGLETKTLLIGYDKRNTLSRFPIKVYSSEKFSRIKDIESIVFGSFFGILLLITFVTILAGLYLKRSTLIAYGIYSFSIFLYLFTSLGLTFQYITPDYPILNRYNLIFLGSGAMMCLVLFVQKYFRTRENLPFYNRMLNILMGIFGFHMMMMSILTNVFESFASLLSAINYVSILASFPIFFIIAWRMKNRFPIRSQFFVLGITCSFFGIFYSILIDLGLFKESATSDNSLSILTGFFLEFILLTLALIKTLGENRKPGNERPANTEDRPEYVFINNERIKVEDILYIESYGHYLKYHLKNQNQLIIVRQTMKDAISSLRKHSFSRVHRSFIVNLDNVRKLNAREVLMMNDQNITISKSYREEFKSSYSNFVRQN